MTFAIDLRALRDRAAQRSIGNAGEPATQANAASRLMPSTQPVSQLAALAGVAVLQGTGRAKASTAANDTPATRTHPHRLTPTDADRCHSPCWDDTEISTFTTRVMMFVRRGIGTTDADDLAERLVLRDRDLDDRRMCLECLHLMTSRRCAAAALGKLPDADRRLEPLPTILQRCEAFGLRGGMT